MKKFSNFLIFFLLSASVLISCDKKDNNSSLDDKKNPADTIENAENPDTIASPIDTINTKEPEDTTPGPILKNIHVFFSISAENKIAQYALSTVSGELSFIRNHSVSGSPGCLVVDKTNDFFYAALRSNNSVAAFEIDDCNCSLKYLETTKVVDNPVYISVDENRNYLFFASYGANKIAVYPITKSGPVGETAIQILDVGEKPHMIATGPQSKFVFVPSLGTDKVLQYKLETDGKLTENSPAYAESAAGSGPRHFTFHPSKNIFYNVNELNSTVNVFDFNETNGTLTFIQNISTLPADYSGTNSCADIHTTPDGKYLYASNRGHNSIAAYSVNSTSGELTEIGQYSTEATPREFDIDPTGQFVIVAGQSSGKAAVHKIKTDGSLEIVNTYTIGSSPAWVLIFEIKECKAV